MGPTCDDSHNNIKSASVLRKLQRIPKGEHGVHVVLRSKHLVGLAGLLLQSGVLVLHDANSNILLGHIFLKLLYL